MRTNGSRAMAGQERFFAYTKAVVCDIPASLPGAALRMDSTGDPVDLNNARRQHQEYVKVLEGVVKEVHVLPADERYPDCVFVEDPVVVCDKTALVTIPGHESRRGEGVALRGKMLELGLEVVDMVEPGHMDGGDVLFTGREFFVGLSSRTNEDGIRQLTAAFSPYPVTSVPIQDNLHLKSFLSMAAPDLIAIGASPAAKAAREVIEEKGCFKYTFFEVPDDIGANCLCLNNHLVHCSRDAFPATAAKWEEFETSAKKVPLSATEMNKVDGCFTCCSVLIK